MFMVEINFGTMTVVGVLLFLTGVFCGRLFKNPRRISCDHEWSKKTAQVELTGKYAGSDGVVALWKCSKCPKREAELHYPNGVKSVSVIFAESFMERGGAQ